VLCVDCLRLLREYAVRQQTYLALLTDLAANEEDPANTFLSARLMAAEAKIDLDLTLRTFEQHMRDRHGGSI
jgi:hypothetical protein